VQSQVSKEATTRGIAIVADVTPGLRALVNARLAEQALANLVSNAVKYSPDETTVTIRVRPGTLAEDRPGVEFRVIDQGPGLAPEHLPRIFERFYRVDKARSREQGGTGLGLSIVKHIALVHSGQVSVESEIGRGSTFRLVFPAPEGRADVPQAPARGGADAEMARIAGRA
jgi:two-component system phosphate regulon sensor histidine kinase PhoR